MFQRQLTLPRRSFFLFGPRATGKSTWLRTELKDAAWFDLLRNDVYFPLSSRPGLFREQVLACPATKWIVVDEVQRLPALLNDVHSLIEEKGYRFALTGSSARKLKRGQANLLAGRALLRSFFPLTRAEYGDAASVEDALKFGTLPGVLSDPSSRIQILEAYAGTYLREEIKEEALTRNVDSFSRFLQVAALANGQVTNLASLARDAGVARATVSTYFAILQDTLLLRRLDAWIPRARVKEVSHPKYYLFDCGVLRAIQGRLREPVASEERGQLLETYLFHELTAAVSYLELGGNLSFWRTPDKVEVDFIWERGNRRVAIEVKASRTWKPAFEKGLHALLDSDARPSACFGVYLGNEALRRPWGLALPVAEFLDRLAAGEILDPA